MLCLLREELGSSTNMIVWAATADGTEDDDGNGEIGIMCSSRLLIVIYIVLLLFHLNCFVYFYVSLIICVR